MVRGGNVVYIFHPSLFPRFTVFNNALKINRVHLCEREHIQGNGDQYEFPDGAGINPEEDVAVLGRCILYLRQVGAAKELIQKLEQGDAAFDLLLYGRRIKPSFKGFFTFWMYKYFYPETKVFLFVFETHISSSLDKRLMILIIFVIII